MIFRKKVFFAGNRERLHKYIQGKQGKMLKHQAFVVTLKSDKVKRYAAIPFCFYCRYQKCENGYDIRYFPCISVLGFVRFLLGMAGFGYIFYQRQVNLFFAFSLLILLCMINYFVQRSQCVRQFEAACLKNSSGEKNAVL